MKYSERELNKRDIFKIEDGWYLLGDTEVNTDEEYDNAFSSLKLRDIDLSNFQVSDNDLVIVHTWGEPTNKWNLLITNCSKTCDTVAYAFAHVENSCLGDDNGYYFTHHVAEHIRQMGVKNVTVKLYLWRTEEEIEDYMQWLEDDFIL